MLIPLVALVVLAIVIELLRPGSFTLDRLGLKSTEVMALALVAAGQTIVVLRGGIDLSVAGTISLVTAIAATRGDEAAALPWLVALPLLGLGIGFANGTHHLGAPPPAVRGHARHVVDHGGLRAAGAAIRGARPCPGGWTSAVTTTLGGVPVAFVLLLVLLGWWMWFRGTRLGEWHPGGRLQRASGVSWVGYRPSGATLPRTGCRGCSPRWRACSTPPRPGPATPPWVATTSCRPSRPWSSAAPASPEGRGGLVGTIVGVIILNFIGDVVFLLQLPSYWQPVATGLILVAVVIASALVDRLSTRGMAGGGQHEQVPL